MKRICAVLVLLALVISLFSVVTVEAVNVSGSCGDQVRRKQQDTIPLSTVSVPVAAPMAALVRVKLTDGVTVNSKLLQQSFRQLTESVNADPTAYDATQLAEIKAMLAKYEVIKNWNIPNLTNQ